MYGFCMKSVSASRSYGAKTHVTAKGLQRLLGPQFPEKLADFGSGLGRASLNITAHYLLIMQYLRYLNVTAM